MKSFFYLFFLISLSAVSQSNKYTFEANYLYGTILPHNKSILHLIKGMPEGLLIAMNKKTFGSKQWEALYNYPDYGLSFQYQNNKNEVLGNLYSIYAHMNFYFFKRNLQFRVAQGIAYNTNPYNINNNFFNVAYGVHIMPSTYFSLAYTKQNIFKNIGLQAGFNFTHHSNANIKAPNTSTNTLAFTFGLNYSFPTQESLKYIPKQEMNFNKKIHYNLFFRTGFCESDVPNSGVEPFYVGSFYIDKQVSQKSQIQVGLDAFWMMYLKKYIKYDATVFPEMNRDADSDYRRLGLFAGYGLLVNKLTIDLQAGYYLYDPSKKNGSIYQRLGLRYNIDNNLSTGISLKTHVAQAEALEFSLGYRL